MIPSDETLARSILHEIRARVVASPETSCWLIHAPGGAAGQLMLIGTDAPARVFVHADASLAPNQYSIEASAEHMLPPKTRQLPKFE